MLESLNSGFGKGGFNPQNFGKIIGELQGLHVNVVTGAAANTAMTLAAIRNTDTIVSGILMSSGVPSDITSTLSIQSLRASGTLTVASVIDGSSCNVAGTTFTFKDTPTDVLHVKRTAGDNTANALALKNKINSYFTRFTGSGYGVPTVSASVSGAVVTVTSVADGAGNGVAVTGTVTTLAATLNNTMAPVLTCATVVADNTFSINGVTFTVKASPTLDTHVLLSVTTDTQQALNIISAVNAYQAAHDYELGNLTLTNLAGVVTITNNDARTGNQIVLTGTVTVLAASGSGTLAGGTATGTIKSTGDSAGKTIIVVWFKKPS